MEADDFLCSRNARPEKVLVERAQWKTNLPRLQVRDGRLMCAMETTPAASLNVGEGVGTAGVNGTSREIDCEAIGG